ncbi:MAG: hypothetical protein WDM87_18295 [Terracidiphilus sp.]
MNRYLLIRRLRGPAFLLLVGVIALLAQADILSWGQSWPLFLILAGLLLLAERAALAGEGYPPPAGTPWQNTNPGTGQTAQTTASTAPGTAIVPAEHQDFGDEIHGGQS